jgi:hypothetical protein
VLEKAMGDVGKNGALSVAEQGAIDHWARDVYRRREWTARGERSPARCLEIRVRACKP